MTGRRKSDAEQIEARRAKARARTARYRAKNIEKLNARQRDKRDERHAAPDWQGRQRGPLLAPFLPLMRALCVAAND